MSSVCTILLKASWPSFSRIFFPWMCWEDWLSFFSLFSPLFCFFVLCFSLSDTHTSLALSSTLLLTYSFLICFSSLGFIFCSPNAPLATSCEELTHWKRLWCWEGLGAGGEGDDRGWDGWMASPTQWTWVWVNSGSWWWTGRPGVLRFMGSQSRTRLSDWSGLKRSFLITSCSYPMCAVDFVISDSIGVCICEKSPPSNLVDFFFLVCSCFLFTLS